MPITLGSNIASLRAVRNLDSNSAKLAGVYARLSSGMRINSASDDAAGLAIADSLKADSRIYTQAIRNVSDGLSMLSIAEGAISNLSTIMTRIGELAEQSANGVYSTSQRTALANEADALKSEYNRIVSSTSFNGKQLLSDTSQTQLQIGLDSSAGARLSVSTALISQSVGDGTFQAESNHTANGTNGAIESADFNGDGKLDVVTLGSGTGGFAVKLGNGDGTFLATNAYSSGVSTAYYQEIAIGDVNGDGVNDLLTTGTYSDNISVLIGNSNGTFQAARLFSAVSTGVNNDIQLGDFNGDSKMDIATVDYSNKLMILFGNGDGNFQAAISQAAAGLGQIAHGDINSDGRLDIVSGSGVIMLGNGDGTFLYNTAFGGVGRSTALTDVNGDGILDALGAHQSGTLRVALGVGNGTFGSTVTYAAGGISNNDYQLTVGDLNGDGFTDAVIAENNTDTVGVFLSTGTGSFSARVSYSAATGAGFVGDRVTIGDFNGDGAVDLAVGKLNSIGLMLGNPVSSATIGDIDISSQASARTALDDTKEILSRLSNSLGSIGASQSRLETSLASLSVSRENSLQAEARIRDADIAHEAGQLVRLQILQQAGASVLAQANQQPALALQLLG